MITAIQATKNKRISVVKRVVYISVKKVGDKKVKLEISKVVLNRRSGCTARIGPQGQKGSGPV